MRQRTFFDAEFDSDMSVKASHRMPPTDRNVIPPDEPRLTGQNAAIFARLKRGPATNAELAAISLKYTSRISDIRAHGYRIECRRGEGGVNVYVLEKP